MLLYLKKASSFYDTALRGPIASTSIPETRTLLTDVGFLPFNFCILTTGKNARKVTESPRLRDIWCEYGGIHSQVLILVYRDVFRHSLYRGAYREAG